MVKNGDSYIKTLFILLVEIVSEFSRPFSLTVRLTVNIIVGHLFCLVLFNIYEFSINLIFLSILPVIIEFFVFIIQRYIFSRLIFLYLND
jgi:F0F1-type ATP synthase membrane subunit a